jgi:CRP-like cAMP-binding protein
MPQISQSVEPYNRLLKRLPRDDFALLAPHLEPVDLPLRHKLEVRNRRIEHVYFPRGGFASVVINGSNGNSIEVALIGREGMTGLAVLMGTDRAPYDIFIQFAGEGYRMTVDSLRRLIARNPRLHSVFLRYGHAFIVQSAYTSLANARFRMDERLARWLLMAHDRVENDEMLLTHEFLALMLGARRPGVTVALNHLADRGLIRTSRGTVTMLDRKALEKVANGAYGGPEAEFQRLFG